MTHLLQKTILACLLILINLNAQAQVQTIKITYITQEYKVPAALSNLDAFIQLKGMVGAEMAVAENNITGQFTGQKFELHKVVVPVEANVLEVFEQQSIDNSDLVITNLPLKQLIELTESVKEKLFFDATTTDDDLRQQHCNKDILHMLPSRAMRADGLAQYMMKKRWNDWFLVAGMTPADAKYAAAIKRAAKRFGIKLVAEKQWTHTYDARRTAQSDVPVFTQGFDYDVLVVADEQGLFGEYIDYRTWNPRPVIGTQSLVATSWHRVHEQWGAVQIQNRFKAKTGRWMAEQDYAAYLAVRAIGEAAVRTKSNQMQIIKEYMLSDQFALQGYKGKPLSFRPWSGQLRQPVLLATARSLVAVAPIEGYLHPQTELDTLGFDQSETACLEGKASNVEIPSAKSTKTKSKESKIDQIIKKIKHKLKQLEL